MSGTQDNVLQRLQRWYASYCDQDWEHSYGVKIETLDNPGWLVHIDLERTRLREANFIPVAIGDYDGMKPEPQSGAWITCRIHDKSTYVLHEGCGRVWIGACSPDELESLLKVFLDWADSYAAQSPT